jgi:diamine N-acetyltransferase
MHAVAFRATGIREIELIRPLWEQLNAYHYAHSSRFKAYYERMSFEDRRDQFQKLHESGLLLLDLATDTTTGLYVGYCVGFLSVEMTGELESLFVDRCYRSDGIGTALVTRCLTWMDSCGAVRKRVSVAEGNEAAWVFYRKFGFLPRMTVLEQNADPE